MADTIPVIFDTDIGSDIDDAVALAYLLAEPRCELLGITTVTGDVARRAALAQVLCAAAGKGDVPIHCGAPDILLTGPGQPDVPQYDAVRDLPHRLDWPPATAIDFMRQTIRERPKEITLLSVGPLTNVALLFALDREVPSLLHSWVSMGGDFRTGADAKLEWNCRADPYATAIAFRHHPPRHLHVPLDVTLQLRMHQDEVRSRFTGPVLRLVARMAAAWFTNPRDLVFHDPLAAALVFDESLCATRRGTVSVEPSTGRTSFEPNTDGPDKVTFEVKQEPFFERFFSVF
jgi:purine nucleosidase